MNKIIPGLALFTLFTVCTAAGMELASDGKTQYAIVCDPGAPPTDQFAARELKMFLDQSTGADFKIVASAPDKGRFIFLGPLRQAKKIIGEKRFANLKNQEAAIVSADDSIAIAGQGKLGTIYGVYSFLENQIGCRWLTLEGDNIVPKHRTLLLPKLDYTQKPYFDYRWIQTIGYEGTRTSEGTLFLFRNRMNLSDFNYRPPVVNPEPDAIVPERVLHNPMCHTLFSYIPPEEKPHWAARNQKTGYLKTNPEFFTLDEKGRRVARQLCFSNKVLRVELTRVFLEFIGKKHGEGVFALTQEDVPKNFCNCIPCLKLDAKYSVPYGGFIEYILELSSEMAKKYPEARLLFSAYRKEQTQTPPSNLPLKKLPDNLIVEFCPIDNDFSKDYRHKNNLSVYNDLKEWGTLSNHLWAYYYTMPYGGYAPVSTMYRWAADTRLAAEAGARGVCYEHKSGWLGINNADLQTWILLKLYQNPFQDYKPLIKEFCDYYYGPVSNEIQGYVAELEKRTAEYPVFLPWHVRINDYLTPPNLVRWNRLFDSLEHKAGKDPALLRKIRECRLGLDLITLEKYLDVKRFDPAFKDSAADIHKRGMATLDAMIARRYPNDMWPGQSKTQHNHIAKTLNANLLTATVRPSPLPEQFSRIPESDIRQLFPGNSRHCTVVNMPDAAIGHAVYDEKLKPDEYKLPFPCGFYDNENKKHVISHNITREEIVPDRFHLYKIGKASFSRECQIWAYPSWRVNYSCERFFEPGRDNKWEVWLSLKFEGPAFSAKNTEKENRVWFDRAVFVKCN